MDQSTQVNFPIVGKNQHRNMRRHNTSADLYNGSPRSYASTLTQIRMMSQRPKSLHLSSPDTIGKSKAFYASDSPILRLSAPGELHLGSISRERTPPFSSSSSIISNGGFKPPPYVPPKMGHRLYPRDDESTGSGSKCCCCCRCNENESSSKKSHYLPPNTPDGLSWRRLHMSRAKLKATATTSELLSGFAMIAMVELQINEPTSVPEWLFVMFSVCTTILVAVHIFALMISTYILPNIEAIAKLEVCEMVNESPHERMRGFIELAWAFSTVLGLFLFLIEVAILCWVKFWDYSFTAAIAATVIVIPVLITFVLFAVHFYHSLVVFKCNSSIHDMEKLEDMKKHLDEVTASPV